MKGYQGIMELLKEKGVEYQEYTHGDISTFEMGKVNTNFDINKIVKTLAFKTEYGKILVALLGKSKLDYKKLADALGIKRSQIKMLEPNEVEEMGFEPGGISPIIQDEDSRLLIDERIKYLDYIYCGMGTRNKTLQIKPTVLREITKGVSVDVSRAIELDER